VKPAEQLPSPASNVSLSHGQRQSLIYPVLEKKRTEEAALKKLPLRSSKNTEPSQGSEEGLKARERRPNHLKSKESRKKSLG